MSKKVDTTTFFEYFSHRIIEIGIPVIVTLIFDAVITRFLEKTTVTVSLDRAFSQTIYGDTSEPSIKWAIIIAIILIVMIIIVTALLLLCYYYGCVKLIMAWMIIAVTILLTLYIFIAFGKVPELINTPFDWIAVVLLIVNIAVIGDLSIFWRAPAIFTHVFLIFISVLIAIVFLNLPDWTVWILLGILVIYDCCVVLCPHGLLKVIIQKSEERGDSIPALVYSSAAWISKIYHPNNEYENGREEDDEENPNSSEIDEDGSGNGGDGNDGEDNDNNASPNKNNTNNQNDSNNARPPPNLNNQNNSNGLSDSDDGDNDIKLVDTENPQTKNSKNSNPFVNNTKTESGRKNDESNQPLLTPNDPKDPNDSDSDGIFQTHQTRKLDDDDNNDDKSQSKTRKSKKEKGNEENGEDEKNEKDKKVLTEEEIKEKKRKRFESDDDEEGIKLGLGDFVFYGILVTRAARVGWDVIILCIFAVVLGLSLTLIILAIVEKPLPALPFSLVLGVIFYVTGIYTFRPFYLMISELKITF